MSCLRWSFAACTVLWISVSSCWGQLEGQLASQKTDAAPLVLTFQDAVARARRNLPQFLSARTDLGLAHEDRVRARAALLPTVTANTQFLYTQPNGTPTGVFIANNTIHEYVAQGNAHEMLNLAGGEIHDLRRTRAAEAALRARLEIAGRGLMVTVAQTFSQDQSGSGARRRGGTLRRDQGSDPI